MGTYPFTDVTRNELISVLSISVTLFLQIFIYKSLKVIKDTVLVGYTVQILLFNDSQSYLQWLINNCFTNF